MVYEAKSRQKPYGFVELAVGAAASVGLFNMLKNNPPTESGGSHGSSGGGHSGHNYKPRYHNSISDKVY